MERLTWLVLPIMAAVIACSSPSSDSGATDTIAIELPIDSVLGMDAPEVAAEVGDGVVVVPAPRLPGVVRIDFAAGKLDSAGRSGSGPGEFRAPFFVQAMSGGAVLVLDGIARRVTILDSFLKFREQFTEFGGLPPFSLRFDTLGNMYSVATATGPISANDSLAVLRRRINEATTDTVTFVKRLPLYQLRFGNNAMMVPAEYAPRDIWGVHLDGTVWVGRGERAEIEFIAADRSSSRHALPFAPIATVDADRQKFRGLPAPAELDTVTRTMAPIKSPFQEIRAAPDGHLFLWLNQPAGYDRELVAELDRSGRLVRLLTLPLGSKLVLATESHLYTTQESDDGTWVLRRHRRPS